MLKSWYPDLREIWAEVGPSSDLGCGALKAILGDCDDVGGQDAAEDVEVQEIGFISAGGVETCVSGFGQVSGSAGTTHRTSRVQWLRHAPPRSWPREAQSS